MPTANPSITASNGAELETVTPSVIKKMMPTTIPTPRIALARGIHAGRNDRNVMMSTMPAKMTPKSSAMVRPGVWS
ncbi:unannotated protein [freshwater metagenome]|uniref:Unannotated protein n=1 Tax=freshwater metagenome TaxID=449393 RepID=A0A6J6JUN5_9ZZZZ